MLKSRQKEAFLKREYNPESAIGPKQVIWLKTFPFSFVQAVSGFYGRAESLG